jgi:hypothetical protein
MQHPAHLSSCIRSPLLQHRLLSDHELLQRAERPCSGDIVFVEVIGTQGAYTKIETAPSGIDQPLAPGDRFFGVLANRFSGHNPSGIVPPGPLKQGDELHLLAIGGIVGHVSYVPAYSSSKILQLKVIGFPRSEGGTTLNIEAFPCIPPKAFGSPGPGVPLLTAAGSSAEVGKTSIVEAIIKAALERLPDLALGAVKICGTGRLKDAARYKAAGARWVGDFVDAGLASTYGVDNVKVLNSLGSLLHAGAEAGCEAIICEVGGDPLEAGAPILLKELSLLGSSVVFVTSDALAAMSGLSILRELNYRNIAVASMRQNAYSLAGRLKIGRAFDVGSRQDAKDIFDICLASEVAAKRIGT